MNNLKDSRIFILYKGREIEADQKTKTSYVCSEIKRKWEEDND